ncbi:MAG: HAD-IA family hydrolase [Candidatus Saccharimonadales bacterium]
MIRGIIFDCFGVLYRGSLGHLYDITSPEHRDDLMNLSRTSDLGYVTKDDYITAVAGFTHKEPSEVATILSTYHIRNEAMFELVRSLHPEYKVALLSNVGQHVMDGLFTSDELSQLFDEVVLSSDVHIMKPDPAIFELMAQRMGLLPEECVMIDDLETNITGAIRAGMQGIVCVSSEQTATDLRALLSGE